MRAAARASLSTESAMPPRRAQRPRSPPLVGDAPRLLLDPLSAFLSAWRGSGDVVRFRVAPRRAYLIAHPDDVRHVLHRRREIYRRDIWHAVQLRSASGRGLTASEGALWSRQRRLLRPAFDRNCVSGFGRRIADAATRMLERWSPVARRGDTVDLNHEMSRLSLEVIARCLFCADLEAEAEETLRQATAVLGHLYAWLRLPLPVSARRLSEHNRRFQHARLALYTLADRLLVAGASRSDPGSFLSLLLEQGEADLARDQIVTMILAGHETTGAALAWACLSTFEHPEVEERLRREAHEALGAADDVVAPPHLPYARRVFRETLRLYPPAWTISRTPVETDMLGETEIPARATVFVSPFVTHRHPCFWDAPARFDPNRFDRAASSRHPYAYFPFGAGPRMCIGKSFAELVGELVLSMVVRSYRLAGTKPNAARMQARLTLQPRGVSRVAVAARE